MASTVKNGIACLRTPTPHIKWVNQLFYTMIVIVRSLRRRRTDLLDVGEQTVGETTRRRNDRNSNQLSETIYKNITHSYLQNSVIQVAATKLWAIKKPFEPAVLFSMSLSWMLWQYTKICLESFHQLLNGVITESHLVKTYFDDAALILVTFLGTTLLCGAL